VVCVRPILKTNPMKWCAISDIPFNPKRCQITECIWHQTFTAGFINWGLKRIGNQHIGASHLQSNRGSQPGRAAAHD
jgi:hypothetical protein